MKNKLIKTITILSVGFIIFVVSSTAVKAAAVHTVNGSCAQWTSTSHTEYRGRCPNNNGTCAACGGGWSNNPNSTNNSNRCQRTSTTTGPPCARTTCAGECVFTAMGGDAFCIDPGLRLPDARFFPGVSCSQSWISNSPAGRALISVREQGGSYLAQRNAIRHIANHFSFAQIGDPADVPAANRSATAAIEFARTRNPFLPMDNFTVSISNLQVRDYTIVGNRAIAYMLVRIGGVQMDGQPISLAYNVIGGAGASVRFVDTEGCRTQEIIDGTCGTILTPGGVWTGGEFPAGATNLRDHRDDWGSAVSTISMVMVVEVPLQGGEVPYFDVNVNVSSRWRDRTREVARLNCGAGFQDMIVFPPPPPWIYYNESGGSPISGCRRCPANIPSQTGWCRGNTPIAPEVPHECCHLILDKNSAEYQRWCALPAPCQPEVQGAVCVGDSDAVTYIRENTSRDCLVFPNPTSAAQNKLDFSGRATHTRRTIMGLNEESVYCKIACAEEYTFRMPGSRNNVIAGTYFDLNRPRPLSITARRTCITSNINNEIFDNELGILRAQFHHYQNIDFAYALTYVQQMEEIIGRINQCTEWSNRGNRHRYLEYDVKPVITYDYEEEAYMDMIRGRLNTFNERSVSRNEQRVEHCRSVINNNEYNCSPGALSTTTRHERPIRTIRCTGNVCAEVEELISANTNVREIVTKDIEYRSEPLWWSDRLGRVRPSPTGLNNPIELGHVFPVSLRTPVGVYQYRLDFRNRGQDGRLEGVVAEAERQGIVVDNNQFGSPLLTYVCTYAVEVPPLVPCDPCDEIIQFGRNAIIYRPVSLNHLFPNANMDYMGHRRNAIGRTMGSNWRWTGDVRDKSSATIREIENLGENAYRTPQYSYTLTPTNMRAIRAHNANNRFSDFNLRCTNGRDCRSDFLSSTQGTFFTDELSNPAQRNIRFIHCTSANSCRGPGPSWKIERVR